MFSSKEADLCLEESTFVHQEDYFNSLSQSCTVAAPTYLNPQKENKK